MTRAPKETPVTDDASSTSNTGNTGSARPAPAIPAWDRAILEWADAAGGGIFIVGVGPKMINVASLSREPGESFDRLRQRVAAFVNGSDGAAFARELEADAAPAAVLVEASAEVTAAAEELAAAVAAALAAPPAELASAELAAAELAAVSTPPAEEASAEEAPTAPPAGLAAAAGGR